MATPVTRRKRYPRNGRAAERGLRERVATRSDEAMRLRISGLTFRDIGARLHCSAMQAHRDVSNVLDALASSTTANAVHLRQLESERLDRLTAALSPKAEKGDVDACRALVRVMERRARLFGLDAVVAQQLEISGRNGAPFAMTLSALSNTELLTRIDALKVQLRELVQLEGEQTLEHLPRGKTSDVAPASQLSDVLALEKPSELSPAALEYAAELARRRGNGTGH